MPSLLLILLAGGTLAAAEMTYPGRTEIFEISLPAYGNESVTLANMSVHLSLPDWLAQPLMPAWAATILGIAAAFILSLILMMACCLCSAGQQHAQTIPCPPWSACSELVLTSERLRVEALLGLAVQWAFFCLACICARIFRTQPPAALLLLAMPWLARNLWLNWLWRAEGSYSTALQSQGYVGKVQRACACLTTTLAMLLGKLELLDAVSDGLAVASAYFLPYRAQHRFIASFSHSGFFGAVCDHLGLGNLMLLALLYSTAVQGGLMFHSGPQKDGILAELGGFARIKLPNPVDEADKTGVQLFVLMVRVCGESMLQGFLQTSLVMAKGQSLFAQPVLALSMALGCTTLGVKAGSMIMLTVQLIRERRADWQVEAAIQGILAVLTWAVLAVILLKLYASQSCESRLWGLTTGCVTF